MQNVVAYVRGLGTRPQTHMHLARAFCTTAPASEKTVNEEHMLV